MFLFLRNNLLMCTLLGWVPWYATADDAAIHLNLHVPKQLRFALHQLFWEHPVSCDICGGGRIPTVVKPFTGTGVCPIEDWLTRGPPPGMDGFDNAEEDVKGEAQEVARVVGGRARSAGVPPGEVTSEEREETKPGSQVMRQATLSFAATSRLARPARDGITAGRVASQSTAPSSSQVTSQTPELAGASDVVTISDDSDDSDDDWVPLPAPRLGRAAPRLGRKATAMAQSGGSIASITIDSSDDDDDDD